MERLYSKQRNAGIHKQSFRGMGASTLTFYDWTPIVSRALLISLVRIPITHMESLYSKQRNAVKSRLFLTEFINTVLEEWGQIH